MDIYDLIDINDIAIEAKSDNMNQFFQEKDDEMKRIYTIKNMLELGTNIIKRKEKHLASHDKAKARFAEVYKHNLDGTIPGLIFETRIINGVLVFLTYANNSKTYFNFTKIDYFVDNPGTKKLTMKYMSVYKLRALYKKLLKEKLKKATESDIYLSENELESAINVVQEGFFADRKAKKEKEKADVLEDERLEKLYETFTKLIKGSKPAISTLVDGLNITPCTKTSMSNEAIKDEILKILEKNLPKLYSSSIMGKILAGATAYKEKSDDALNHNIKNDLVVDEFEDSDNEIDITVVSNQDASSLVLDPIDFFAKKVISQYLGHLITFKIDTGDGDEGTLYITFHKKEN